MKIKIPKPTMRDPNALNAKSRKSAGSFKDKRLKREQQKFNKFLDESGFFDSLADIEIDWEEEEEIGD